MRSAHSAMVGLIVGLLMSIVPSVAVGQGRDIRLGAEGDFVGLFGDWNSGLESGFGAGAFAVLHRGLVEGRLGGAVSFHFVEAIDPAISSSGSRRGDTYRMERFFGEVRVVPLQGAQSFVPFVGLRLGLLHHPIDRSPWAGHLEVPAGVRLQRWMWPELYVSAGLAVFSKDNWQESRTAPTLRIGSSFSLSVAR
jgi:hypothetical protein